MPHVMKNTLPYLMPDPPAVVGSRRRMPSRRRQDVVRQNLLSCERRQLAQQIHDDLGAMLTAIKSCLCVAISRHSQDAVSAADLLEDASVFADSAFATVRKIGVDLRPVLLEQMGMFDAIAWQSQCLARRSGLHVTFYYDAGLQERCFVPEYERIVYRVMNEALTNAEKHSRGTRLNLFMYERDSFLIAAAEDDGIGMLQTGAQAQHSLGMTGMREQACEAGGFLTVETRECHGMGVYLAIPTAYCYER